MTEENNLKKLEEKVKTADDIMKKASVGKGLVNSGLKELIDKKNTNKLFTVMLNFYMLSSGSRGNSTIIWDDNDIIIIDCGISMKKFSEKNL